VPQTLERKHKQRGNFIAEIVAKALGDAAKGLTVPQMTFRTFLKEAWQIIEPANPLQDEWYVDCLCEYLQLVTMGDIRKLLINLPPREGKSNIVTVLWPAWSWTLKAFLRFITCSYSASLSEKHSTMRRNVIDSSWYQERWGGLVRFTPDQNKKQEYENTARGHMIATSVGGTLTGKGGDVIIEDDMMNPLQAVSDAERKAAIDMHKMVLSTRIDNPKTGSRVIVEQRTHDQDVSGYVLANERGWVHVNLPLQADRKVIVTFPISKREIIREPDDILSPRRHGIAEVNELKLTMTPEVFEAQCQQNPSSDVGNILKRTYWKKYTVLPTGFDLILTSWDLSFKKTQAGSYVVGQVWGKRGANFMLFPIMVRKRMDFAQTLTEFKGLITLLDSRFKFKANGHLVEDKANGPAVISTLQNEIPGIVPMGVTGSKAARAHAVAPLIRAGNVLIPDESICDLNERGVPWVLDFIEECAKFRGLDSEINDQVDTATQALIYMHNIPKEEAEGQDEEEVSFIDLDEGMQAGGFGL
jgi:predicted phage terminase large subunit-like protein